MPIYTWKAIYIGTFADIDTNESNTSNESEASLLDVHGSATDPLSKHIVNVSVNDANGDHLVGRNNVGFTPESMTIQGAAATLDTAVTYNTTITYVDGTTAKITDIVFQTTDGKVYLAPEGGLNTDTLALEAKAIRSVNFTSVKKDSTDFRSNRYKTNFVCYGGSVNILTALGPVPAVDISIGMAVHTHDNGPQSVRWVGKRRLGADFFQANPKQVTVLIKAGALGSGLPIRDILVSPQHRVLVRSTIAFRMFGLSEVFVTAVKLIGFPGITRATHISELTYVHFAFDRHEVVYAEGALSESLLMGPEALKSLEGDELAELRHLFSNLPDVMIGNSPARFIPSGSDQKHLIERHLRNKKPLYSCDLPDRCMPFNAPTVMTRRIAA